MWQLRNELLPPRVTKPEKNDKHLFSFLVSNHLRGSSFPKFMWHTKFLGNSIVNKFEIAGAILPATLSISRGKENGNQKRRENSCPDPAESHIVPAGLFGFLPWVSPLEKHHSHWGVYKGRVGKIQAMAKIENVYNQWHILYIVKWLGSKTWRWVWNYALIYYFFSKICCERK